MRFLLFTGFVIVCGGSRTAHTARRYLASGSVLWPCTIRRAVASERSALKYGYTVYIACQALDILAGTADRLALSGSIWLITAHIVPVVRRRAHSGAASRG